MSDGDLPIRIEPAPVLVVDDEPANLQAAEAALDGLEVEVVSVSSGEDALRELLQRDVALILLDVKMPKMDGFELARIIRARPRARHIPIIFLTGHSQSEADIRLGYELGAVDYLLKPVVGGVLRAKVQALVELRNRTAQVHAQSIRLRELERAAADQRLQDAKRAWEAEALRRQMAEQRAMNERLAEADRNKDEFLALLAHELRNPLAPLVSGLELVRLGAGADGKLLGVCDAMSRQVSHLVRLVDDLLDVARIARGKVALQRADVDLRECVEHAVETCASMVEGAGLTLDLDVGDKPLLANVDAVRVAQVVTNLLTNAVRYTDAGGTIHVAARPTEEEALIQVRDTGRGMDEKALDRVFDMFFQERAEGRGLGLGLTLVQQIAGLHGGSVAARSDGIGRGSEFEVRFPLGGADAPAQSAADSDAEATASTDPLRVLLVDDDPDGARTIRSLLETWGHRVEVAHTGREGVRLAAKLEPDLVLLDIGLPDIDGYEVAETISRETNGERPRLVALTGFGRAEDRRRAKEAGFDEHLVKPADPERLQAAVRRRSEPARATRPRS